MRILAILFIASAASAAPSPTVAVTAAPPIATAPASGLDPDVVARLDAAEHAIVTGAELERALDRVLVLYESSDAFSVAQRDAARARSVALLTRIGDSAHQRGDVALAARAYDARWTIGGAHRDPELAQVLTTWAERDADARPAQSLYLARRARAADPSHARARELDDDLGRNHRVWTGKLAVIAGFVALAAGFYAREKVGSIESDLVAHPRPGADVTSALHERDTYDAIGTGLLIAAPVLSIGGIVFTLSGQHSYTPTSPAELPALVER